MPGACGKTGKPTPDEGAAYFGPGPRRPARHRGITGPGARSVFAGARGSRLQRGRSDKEEAADMTGLPADYFTAPLQARVHDYWLGGKDNLEVDRKAGEALLDPGRGGHPGLRTMARQNRAFICGDERRDGTVRWLARNRGIRQFLDLGCGLPSPPISPGSPASVHDAARLVIPDAVAAYVDRDPVVFSHVAALMKGEGVAAVRADVTEPARVLEVIADLPLIDFTQPVAVIFGGTLSGMSAQAARETVRGFTERLAAGSAVVISCAHFDDPAVAGRIASVFAEAGWRNRGIADVRSFFDAGGLTLAEGWPGDVRCWPMVREDEPGAAIIGGVGIKD